VVAPAAPWRSGYAAACKAVYTGSIPVGASHLDLDALGTTFVTLTVIMDPIGIAPIFMAVTRRLDPPARRAAAIRAAAAAGGLILGFAVAGRFILDYLGVSVESLSIAGGLLLLLVALEMLRGQDGTMGELAGEGGQDIALVPLATPLVAGPGAIATVIVLSRRYDHGDARLGLFLGILGALALMALALLAAERLSRLIPDAMIHFLTRVLGLLLSAIAVQLVVNGVRGLV